MADILNAIGSIGGALQGASGFVGSLNQVIGGNDYDPLTAFYRQREMMRENNKFQSQENEKSRDFTRQMYAQQWSDYTDYNSYNAMVERAKEAGISPAALFQNGAPSSIGGISPGSVGHSASPSPSYADVVNPVNRQAETFHSISQGLQALSQASKLGLESTRIVPLMSAQIQGQLSQAGLNDIRRSSEEFELGLRKIYGSKLNDSELGKNYAQMIDSYAQAYLYAEQGKTQESVRELNKAERLYKDAKRESTDKQVQMMDLEMQWYPREMGAKIRMMNNQGEEAAANAEQQRIFNKIYSDQRYKHSIISQAVTAGQQAIDANKMTKKQVEHMNYMIEQAAYANDMKEFKFWSDQIQSYMQSIGQAASAFYGAGALRELIKLRKAGSLGSSIESGKGYYLDKDGLLFSRP